MRQVTHGMGQMDMGGARGGGGGDRGRGGGGERGRGGKRESKVDTVDTRPEHVKTNKQGTSGRQLQLTTNYFSFQQKPDTFLFQYRVDFTLDEDRTFMKKALLRQHVATLPKYMFDGSILLCFLRLYAEGADPLVLFSRRKNGDGTEDDCNITIRLVGEIHSTDHHYLQLLSIIQRQMMEKLGLELLGRNYYDPQAASIVQAFNLEVWPGYVTSIRQHENAILMCAEVSNKVIRTDTVYDNMRVIYGRRPQNYQMAVERSLLGSIVMTRYNKKTYRIDGLDWTLSPRSTFDKNGTQQSYYDYYREKYSCTIQDMQQPLLISRPKDRDRRGGQEGPCFLIPELCYMTGLTDEQRADFRLTSALSDWTRMNPTSRAETLLKLSARLTGVPEIREELQKWNMKFSKDLVTCPGRLLEEESIALGKGKVKYQSHNADWTKDLRMGLYNPAHIRKWYLIYPDREQNKVQAFLKSMQNVAPGLGVNLGQPRMISLNGNRAGDYCNEIARVMPEGPQMVFCVVPNEKGDQYSSIKKKCCIEQPVPSQIVTVSKVLNKEKGYMSMATKVVTQMSCKIGAEPWAVEIPIKQTMVVGYDTYHDSARKNESVGALVASLNQNFTTYFSCVDFHKDRTEMSNQVGVMFVRALRKYAEKNGDLPRRVFFYRDGVGEGQVSHVKEHELAVLRDAAAHIKEGYVPQITFIIVSKRINTRLFTGQPRNYGNPFSGTVVDNVVTLPERYDFFLISQSVRQGTVNPTSYNVIEDDSKLKPDQVQRLTYKLTHLYYNWPGTVRVPAPCQYAHKLAFLTGTSLHAAPSEHLNDLLYFL